MAIWILDVWKYQWIRIIDSIWRIYTYTFKLKPNIRRMEFLKRKFFLCSLNSHQFVIKFVACGIWEAHQMSELAPLRRAFCASAFCLYTYDYEVDDIQWRALRTPYVAQSNFCNMCKGILREVFHHHCHNINKTTWFLEKRWNSCLILEWNILLMIKGVVLNSSCLIRE